MKRILLPTDFSENAEKAINYALAMMKGEPCEFILLNTYKEPHSGAAMVISILDILKKDSLEALAVEEARLKPKGEGEAWRITTACEHGDLADVVRSLVVRHSIDLVVMGTKGASGVREMLMGSNAAAIIANCPTTVLAIPENAAFESPTDLGFAADFEHLAQSDMLQPLKELAIRFRARLHVINMQQENDAVNVDKAAIEQALRTSFGPGVNQQYEYVVATDIEKDIEQFIEEKGIQHLFVVRLKRSFLERLFHRSMTRKLAFHTKVPLWVIPQ